MSQVRSYARKCVLAEREGCGLLRRMPSIRPLQFQHQALWSHFGSGLAQARTVARVGSAKKGLPNMKSFAAFALLAVTSQASEDAERARILSEIEALRGQLQKQRTIIQQQFTQLANLEEDEERRLQTVGNVTATAWATEKAALEATDGSMAAAMDTLWLCLCGALVMLLGCFPIAVLILLEMLNPMYKYLDSSKTPGSCMQASPCWRPDAVVPRTHPTF